MRGIPACGRTARYRCVAVIAWPDGSRKTPKAIGEGGPRRRRRGEAGLRRSPIFVPVGLGPDDGRADARAEGPDQPSRAGVPSPAGGARRVLIGLADPGPVPVRLPAGSWPGPGRGPSGLARPRTGSRASGDYQTQGRGPGGRPLQRERCERSRGDAYRPCRAAADGRLLRLRSPRFVFLLGAAFMLVLGVVDFFSGPALSLALLPDAPRPDRLEPRPPQPGSGRRCSPPRSGSSRTCSGVEGRRTSSRTSTRSPASPSTRSSCSCW